MSQASSNARPNKNGNLFEIRTVQSAAFRTLIEALKEILTEANLEFDFSYYDHLEFVLIITTNYQGFAVYYNLTRLSKKKYTTCNFSSPITIIVYLQITN